jgi:hypothetical protein
LYLDPDKQGSAKAEFSALLVLALHAAPLHALVIPLAHGAQERWQPLSGWDIMAKRQMGRVLAGDNGDGSRRLRQGSGVRLSAVGTAGGGSGGETAISVWSWTQSFVLFFILFSLFVLIGFVFGHFCCYFVLFVFIYSKMCVVFLFTAAFSILDNRP